MSTARKNTFRNVSMSAQSRNSSYAAINILWLQMRPDLKFEDKDVIRDERLAWVTSFLQLRKSLETLSALTDSQLGLVLDEMRTMTGTKSNNPSPLENGQIEREHQRTFGSSGNVVNLQQFKLQRDASEEQKFTLGKIIAHLGWSDDAVKNFLQQRGFGESLKNIAFKKANSLTIILLNIAADKQLRRALPEGSKITRKMTMKLIPSLKRQLGIGD